MNVRSVLAFAKLACIIALAQAAPAGAAEVKLLGGTGLKAALDELAPQFERSLGQKLSIRYGSAVETKRHIDAGEPFDVVISTPMIMGDLVKEAKVARDTHSPIARSGLGVVARAGAAKPAIDSPAAFKQALLGAKSIAYFPGGTSGAHMARVFERLGIAEDMRTRLKAQRNAGLVAQAVADGEAELGFTGVSNLLNVRGTQFVGPLPSELQDYVVYEGAVSAAAKNAEGGKALLKFLTAEPAGAVMRTKGLEPAAPR